MILYPAIDVRGGKVVRLREGDPDQQITFSDDPVHTAQRWIEQGAAWLHMVNLDGAFDQANNTVQVLKQVTALGIPVQFGGGLRTLEDARRAIDAGAGRVVFGTAAVQSPDLVAEAVTLWGAERVCAALDARDGKVTTHGWQQVASQTPTELGTALAARGVIHALYTDVSRDGGLQGVNVEATADLGRTTGLRVIASGGVASLDDLAHLKATGMVAGAVIGMALYTGRIQLTDALRIAASSLLPPNKN